MIEGFEILSPVTGAPALSVNDTGLTFNKTAVDKLGKPQFVQFMINRDAKKVAIQKCREDDEGARNFLKSGRDSKIGVRWNNFDLKSEISQLMKWDLSISGKKIKGEYVKSVDALIFDLNSAVALPTRNRGGSDE